MNCGDRQLLSIENVSRSFPGVLALDNVTFHVNAGEVHGLVGENGAGKSTLMAIASGALASDSGTVSIAGRKIRADPEQARESGLAIVRQEPALMPDLSVSENLLLGVAKDHRPAVREAKAWATRLLGLWSENNGISVTSRVSELNPEQRFIVEIVKALAGEPRVLVLDEPTEHLAGEDVQRLFTRVRDVTSRGAAVVYISHRIREVEAICDRITILRDGQCRGTFDRGELSEQQIVEVIVGRSLNREFPPKHPEALAAAELYTIRNLRGEGFSDVSVALHLGEILGVAGIDGNGQREFIRALAGLLPYQGEIRKTENAGLPAGRFSYLTGDRHREGIFADLSVRENFSFRSIAEDSVIGAVSTRAEAARAARAVAHLVVKTPSLETPIGSLSGGNQQKVVIASVLETEPKVLLADEPTQGVDVGTRMEIYKLLRATAAKGTAIVLRSSDAAEVAGLSDRVLIFSRGRVVRELAGEEVSEHNITAAALTTTSHRDRRHGTAGAFWRWAAGDGAPLAMVAGAVLLLGLYASWMNEFFLTARSLSGILPLVAALALVSYGQQTLMLAGGVDLSVGPLMGLILVTESFFLYTGSTMSLQLTGLLLLFLIAAAVGFVNWMLVDLIKLNPLVATLASFMALQALSLFLRPIPGGLIDGRILDMIGTKIGFVPVSFIAAVILAFFMEYALRRTHWGLALSGYGSQPEAARVAGIPPRLVMLLAYVTCSVWAGIAAILMIGQVGIGDAGSGGSYSLASIAAVVIGGASIFGGRGSFIGALLGALLITEVSAVTGFLGLGDAWQSYLLGAMILASVAFYSKSRQVTAAT